MGDRIYIPGNKQQAIEGSLDLSELTEEQRKQVQELTERVIEDRKVRRVGSAVFCVSCGARQRTLYRWHNSYICRDCRKILLDVGEEQFLKALRGEDE